MKSFVEFIIPTFNRREPLMVMLSSLLAQRDKDWSAHVVVDTPEQTVADEIVKMFNDPRIKISHLEKRWNNWGHTPREIGKQQSESEYVIMTGDDNYYTPNFVNELKAATKNKPKMIYWDMVHSHFGYLYLKCEFRTNAVDMGAFATRNDISKQITLKTNYAADGDYVEEFKKRFPKDKVVKINKVLFVHN